MVNVSQIAAVDKAFLSEQVGTLASQVMKKVDEGECRSGRRQSELNWPAHKKSMNYIDGSASYHVAFRKIYQTYIW